MHINDFYIAVTVGLVLSLLVSEMFGVVPGGTIVPGYLALVCDTPLNLVLILLVSFATFGMIKYVLPNFVVLYGRRRYVAALLVSILIKLLLELLFPIIPFITLEFRGIGVVVPGLIANTYCKQGVKLTLAAMLPVVLVTFGILTLLYTFG